MILELYTFLNKKLLDIQARIWFRNHTMQEFEARMIAQGCTMTRTRNSVIFTTPNGLGKIEVTDDEIIINGNKSATEKATRIDPATPCPLCKEMTPHSYQRHLEELLR